MRATTPRILVLLLVPLLAGCMENGNTSSTTTATTAAASTVPLHEGFDSDEGMPAGWSADSGTWALDDNEAAPSAPHVLRGTGGGGRSTLRSPTAYGDFEATVKFQMVTGDEGAGLSFRYEPDGDYRIIRYSVREDGWHYFIMKDGVADKPPAAQVTQNASKLQYGQWVTLRILAEGRHVQAWAGETLVIDFTESEDAAVGAIGPFLRGSAVALFDDVDIKPR